MKIPLVGGAYTARSIIASAQRSINLYPENNPQDSEEPFTHYPTAGLDLVLAGPTSAPVRCVYRATNGSLYAVIGPTVYFVSPLFVSTPLGTIANGTTPVFMADNSLVIVIVDNTTDGYAINMADNTFGKITDPSFYGATRVDYIDTFFVFNRPGTNQWYSSLSEVNFMMLTAGSGAITAGGIDTAGSAYTDGTYTNVPLTGGTGTGAQATITVSGGLVVIVIPTNPGMNYLVGDILSASASIIGGGGSGFTWAVNQINYAFDPLYIAAKEGYADPIQSLIVMHREIWLIGALTTEIWYNAGTPDFPFGILPGTFIEHGCVAPYSVAKAGLSIFWLSQDLRGQAIVMKGHDYQADRISTFALENEFSNYSTVTDAIGYTYQLGGHTFYDLVFPTANKTWSWDDTIGVGLWHENAWTDNDGNLNRHRANCAAFAYSKNIVGDWQNGNLYALDLNTYTDNGQPISRIRSFPHLLDDNRRVMYAQFVADMEVGEDPGSTAANPPLVGLRWSDDRGKTYSNKVYQSLGAQGQYLTNIQWRRLGMARDRVFELSWSIPAQTALNGAFITMQSAAT